MSKKVNRVPYKLNAQEDRLTTNVIEYIIRGTDAIIGSGGRSILAKILKGSKDKKLFERNLDKEPVYGVLSKFTIAEITGKIDWAILHDYIQIESLLSQTLKNSSIAVSLKLYL